MHRHRTALLTAVAIGALGALAGCAAEDTSSPAPTTEPSVASTTTVVRPLGPVDELISVRGARMHLRCEGVGETTILLVAGFAAYLRKPCPRGLMLDTVGRCAAGATAGQPWLDVPLATDAPPPP